MTHLDAGAVRKRKDVLLANIGGAAVIGGRTEVGGQNKPRPPGAAKDVGGRIPI